MIKTKQKTQPYHVQAKKEVTPLSCTIRLFRMFICQRFLGSHIFTGNF